MTSIVIVNWNSGPYLERCVRSLQENAPGYEIVIVDNSSEDTSLEFLPGADPPPTLLRNGRNVGFAAACNQGWRASRGEKVLFLNPDTECQPGGVERLAQVLKREPEVWAAAGRLNDSTGAFQAGFNVRVFPSVGCVAAEMLLLDEIWPRNPWTRRYRMIGWDPDSPCDVEQPAAACLMVRRTVLESLSGFDESFEPAWFEDVDLCKRIRGSGGRIVFEPGAHFLHHGAASLRSLSPDAFLRLFHANQIRYFQKHHGSAAAVRVRRLVIAGLYLRAVLSAVGLRKHSRAPGLPAGAYWKAARHFVRSREAGA